MNRVKKFLLTTCALTSLAAVAIGVSACDSPEQEEHTHSWGNWTVATAPTDSAEGKATRTCSGEGTCDAAAADKEYTLPALTSTDYSKGADSATCTAAGSITYTYNKSGVSVSFDVTTSAKGHGTLASHEAKAADCIEDGYAAYWTCPDCNWLFSDAAGTTKIDAPATVTAKGSHGELIPHEAAPAENCEGPGTKAYWECPDCHWLFSDEEGKTKIDAPVAANHPNATKTNAVDATCTSKGKAAYWTCPDCEKNFSDEACTQEVTDLTSLDTDMIDHQLDYKEGEGATCYNAGVDDYWECDTCHKLFSDDEGTNEISEPVTHPMHPNAAPHTADTITYSGVQFSIPNMYFCNDGPHYVVETENEDGELIREIFSSDLLYVSTAEEYHLLFDKKAGETANVDLSDEEQYKGITFVAPETKPSIYTFDFSDADGSVSITKVVYRQGTENVTVYEDGAWTDAAVVSKFDTTSNTLTNTLTFEAAKNEMVIISLNSSKFDASYSFEVSPNVYLNTAYLVEPTVTETTATLTAAVPEAGTYLVTISGAVLFNTSATFTVEVDEDTATAGIGVPMFVTLSPDKEFTITCNDEMVEFEVETMKYSYRVTITEVKGELHAGDNTVNVTAADSNVDTYTFTADTASDYTFSASAGLIVSVPGKGVSIAAGGNGVVSLEANEKVVVVAVGAVGSYTLDISAGASYDPLPNTSAKIAFTANKVITYSVPDVVTEKKTYKITITGAMNQTVLSFGLNKPTDDYTAFAGAYSNGGNCDLIYQGFGQFAKAPADDSGITATGQMANCTITLTLQPGDTLTFANAYNASIGIVVSVA